MWKQVEEGEIQTDRKCQDQTNREKSGENDWKNEELWKGFPSQRGSTDRGREDQTWGQDEEEVSIE